MISQSKPSVLVSIAPYAYFVKRIAGDAFTIQTLIPAGTNLHIYEPSPRAVEENSSAAVWFRIDEPIEAPIIAALKQRNPQMKIVNLQEGLPLLEGEDPAEHTSCAGHHHDRDLHTWLSPKLSLIQAQKIADMLMELFPGQASVFKQNLNSLMLDLINLQKEIESQLAPYKGRALLVSHPAFGYFCKDYDLVQLAIESEGKEPRPRDVEKIVKEAEIRKIQCVFLQQGFNNRGAQLIAKKLQLPTYRVDPYAWNYVENMRQIAGYIAK